MTKKNKIIMWSTISCLLAVAVAGSAIGITYARYGSTGKGTGTATVAYWDVTVAPSDDTTIKAYAAPSADAYEGGDQYNAAYARTSTSSLILAATATNPGNIDALVSIEQKDGFGYELREGIYTSDDTNDYLSKLDDHFSVILFQSTEADLTSDTDLEELDTFTLESGATTYIYCEVVWTSDIEGCFGTDADAFDTWIGSNVDYLTFTLAYSATQVGLDTEPEPEPEPEPDPEPDDANHTSSDWYYLTNSNVSGATLDTTGNYCLTEDVELTSQMTISADITLCLNGHSLSAASGYTLSQLISVTGGNVTIEDCQENGYIGGSSTNGISISGSAALTLTSGEIKDSLYGITLTSGTTFNMLGGEVTGNTCGVDLVNGATLNLSGTPVITGNNTANVYLESGALISLGELTSGADIGVYTEDYPHYDETDENNEHSSVAISTSETDTYYYESAINYIHCDRDNTYYKIARSNNDRCLNIIETNMINVSVAVKNTTTTTSPDLFYVNGFSWGGNDASGAITWTTSSYNGNYSYDQYYDFGLAYTNTDNSFSIAPSPFAWSTDLDRSGLAPDSTLASNLTEEKANSDRFGLYATQYQGQVDTNWIGAVWYLSMYTHVSDYSVLNSSGDLTIVLEYNGTNLDTSDWNGTNNVVSNVYFITTSGIVNLV